MGIETSCDETAAAVVEDGRKILSNVVVSQIDIFAAYGGVIPEVAARSHLEAILPVIDKALKDAHTTWDDIDAIAVTHAPGLLGSLLIGTLTARTLAILHDKPLYAVHHLKSHVYANWLEGTGEIVLQHSAGPSIQNHNSHGRASGTEIPGRDRLVCCDFDDCGPRTLQNNSPVPFPILALVVSGGHTQILYMPAHNTFEIIGTTRDDAVGECFDKVAKILGLPYPGGPAIARAAAKGDPNKYKFPHPNVANLDFSFSGLKTAVLRTVQRELNLPLSHPSHDLKNHLTPKQVADFAASFQKTAIDILVEKLAKATETYPDIQSIVLAGGVSANQALRQALENAYFPEPQFSGDNGAMVAAAAYYEIISGVTPTDPYALNIYPRISIDNRLTNHSRCDINKE